jgi:NitT/TauT family transport system permease protein
MKRLSQLTLFNTPQPTERSLTWGDAVVLVGVTALMAAGLRLALAGPHEVAGPAISLAPAVLPWYALLSLRRMAAAYVLSVVFTLIYGYIAAYNRRAERVLLPLLDVLQSVPILSFLPVVLLSLSALLPARLAAELTSVVLIFTSQAWNLTFGWYQSLTTIPKELQEAAAVFRFNRWMRLRNLELPFGALSFLWNSMMSWAGGWFFLMAAEIFTVGPRDFRLPGLGVYLQEAASQGHVPALIWGIGTLVLMIALLDQLVWRPLLAWGHRFKLEMVEGDTPPGSWFYEVLRGSFLVQWLAWVYRQGLLERLDAWLQERLAPMEMAEAKDERGPWLGWLLGMGLALALGYGAWRAAEMLWRVPGAQWAQIGLGVGATFLRVAISLLVALGWTLPVGVLIGTNIRVAAWLQPLVQIAAAVPATALFPVLLLLVLRLPGGLNLAAGLLMLTGSQWYLLFNIIAGASAIPQDLKYTTSLLQLTWGQRWRTLILPALFPYVVTGAITASGGAWNASIVAEYAEFGGHTHRTLGIGALIAGSTAEGNYPLLLAATLAMILTVVLLNRLIWRRLYRVAETVYRME